MHNEHSFFNLLFISFFLHFKVYCVVFFFFVFSADMGQFSNFVVLLYEV